MKFPRRMVLVIVATLLGCIAYSLLGEPAAPPPREAEGKADAIVVLGGNAADRVEMAVELYDKGVAPVVVVVVSGDQGKIVAALAGRVPDAAIRHENAATSTMENARFSEPFLRQIGAKDVVIVSSWYHVRRALRIFQHVMPDIQFRVAYQPKSADLPDQNRAMSRRERFAVWHTMLRHGVWSF